MAGFGSFVCCGNGDKGLSIGVEEELRLFLSHSLRQCLLRSDE